MSVLSRSVGGGHLRCDEAAGRQAGPSRGVVVMMVVLQVLVVEEWVG